MFSRFINVKRFHKLLIASDQEAEHWMKLYESSKKELVILEAQLKDSLRYKEFYNDVRALPNCFDCPDYKICTNRISWGRADYTRYNCPLHPKNSKMED